MTEMMLTRKIISFSELINKSTEGFVGRRWVREAVDDFLKAAGPRYFLLLGEPGSGKTAFMADLIRRHGYPHHFIGKGSRTDIAVSIDWYNPIRFAESIGYQLLRDYGGWVMDWDDWGIQVEQEVKQLDGLLVGAEVGRFIAAPRPVDRPIITVEQEVERFRPAARMVGVYIEKFEMKVEQIVYQLLTIPLRNIAERWPNNQFVVVVDGLDEAESYSDPRRNILKMIPNGSLPNNVRFLFSSRPGGQLSTDFLGQCQHFWLSEDESGHQNVGIDLDAETYVGHLANEATIREFLARKNIEQKDFIKKVTEASQGNFLYLHYYHKGLKAGDENLIMIDTLPKGLYGIYEDFLDKLRQQCSVEFWLKNYKPTLGTLAVAQSPLTRALIANLAGVEEEILGALLLQLESFLDVAGSVEDQQYSLYHGSFGEYLISESNVDYIDGQKAHERITRYYLDDFGRRWEDCDDYGLNSVVHHLLEAQLDEVKLDAILKKLFSGKFMEARSDRVGWHMPFVRDLHNVKERSSEQVIIPCLQILRGSHRNSLVNQKVLRLLKEIRPRLTAKGIHLVRPGNEKDEIVDQAIRAMNLSAEEVIPQLVALLARTQASQLRGVIALALGETGNQHAIQPLLDVLVTVKKRDDHHVSWCAADALISLNEPSCVPALLNYFEDPSIKPGVKQRILYILGRMRVQLPLEDARALVAKGLKLRGKLKGRAIDFIYLYKPEDEASRELWLQEQEAWLWEALNFDADGEPAPKWKNEWLQKRLVTALGRIGSGKAIPYLKRFNQLVENRKPPETQEDRRRREGLTQSIQRAIRDITYRNHKRRQNKSDDD